MTKEAEVYRCEICQVLLGESSNVLYVEGRWLHYKCAFRRSVEKATRWRHHGGNRS